ncbi:MAG: transcription-repair coupling factor (superfamily II helicase) [Candidatus Peregrinibacteria bacterium Gr01-1014_25]|nr:MAG: transcription-repair coupling factor (superfamily II helicase) [Candidatus Peregrinibacteria bacterium Gr01-1014_25]
MKPSLLIGEDTHRDMSQLFRKEGHLTVSGAANQTAKALVFEHVRSLNPPAFPSSVILTRSSEEVEAWRHWLHFFECPVRTTPIERVDDASVVHPAVLSILRGDGGVFLLPRDAWEVEVPDFHELTRRMATIKTGEEIAFTAFVEQLLDLGYAHAEDRDIQPGQYRRTGDVLDIHPIQESHVWRVSFHFDRVEAIQDISGGKKTSLEIFPANATAARPLSAQLPEESVLVIDDEDDVPDPKDTRILRFTAFPESARGHMHVRYLSVIKFYTLTDFLNDLRDKIQQDWNLLIVSRRSEELAGIFREEHIPFVLGAEKAAHRGVTVISADEESLLPHSIQNPDLKCALLTDREIFTLRKAGKQRSVQKLALDFLTSLAPGDYVVHMEHGIGRFIGTTQKLVDGTLREYLELHYAEGDKLFIPVDQADKLSKYVHEEGKDPALTRLGGSEWKRVTERLKQETEEVARELLALYAKRASAKGHAYPLDSDAMRKFEATFPYAPTPGQEKAIEDIKGDMEDDRPMDRLVCGDVGFGKTEVAMRAAFKAAQAGKQVAVIAPITILADQHERTFHERMKDFPLRIEMLSRFRTPKEQKVILEGLRKGDVHIVIGTHRLLQPDVVFHNLGLVIIDEEQRFGVKQKERFKELRASVDILTLTATPIPRTLNLGLHKLRDITTITTPPPGRLPIITEVRKYSDDLVRQAILAETKRKGQCFVLHNRVETIDAFAEKLRVLVPEARFIVAHGQLSPDDLEQRILEFKDGAYDVLVSSTIIENGIDLPRANTLIVNEAERFGLSQLYQLRGRVGRGKVQAFAFLLYHSQKLPEDAKKRLRAIVEACELGSGFQVAMRDLEIRGAGEILGANQSGTMQTVGVSHYLRMLKNAVEELRAGKREEADIEQAIEILLPVEALLPSFYIPDSDERIAVYQKLAGSEDEAILAEFEGDLQAEYGEPPRQVRNLFSVLRLKLACRRAGVLRVKAEETGPLVHANAVRPRDIVLTLHPRVTAEHLMPLLQGHPQWRISSNTLRIAEVELKKDAENGDEVMALAAHVALIHKKEGKAKKAA